MTLAIQARALAKHYGDQVAVQGIDLEVEAGECFGLLGPNGAGKTTTLRMLLGLTPPSGGELQVLGWRVPREAARLRARVGVVPQQDNLDPDFSVRENLAVYARYFGIARAVVEARIPELLTFAALEGRSEARIAALSGGMRRRLTLARALVNAPEMLFLDEPTTGLDPQARHLIWQRLRSLRAAGRTLVLTTHYMEEAQRLCDRVAVLDQGRILDHGRPAELIARHIEPQVIEVTGEGAEDWLALHGRALAARAEQVGETVFCYAVQPEPLLERLRAQPELRYLHRPANLEDVFLRLTGRDLRD